MKMDEKVNQKVKKALYKTFAGNQPLALSEMIAIQSMGDPKQRTLPKIEVKEEKLSCGKSAALDSETKEDEKKRLHDFLFKMD